MVDISSLKNFEIYISPNITIREDSFNSRGIFALDTIKNAEVLLSIPRKLCLGYTDVLSSSIGENLSQYSPEELQLSVPMQCFLAAFIMIDKMNLNSNYQLLYDLLPKQFNTLPIFWDEHQCELLEGSFLTQQIEDRKENLEADYETLCIYLPELKSTTLKDFLWARAVVTTRNFGIGTDTSKEDLIVPLADMINDGPNRCDWRYDSISNNFIVTATEVINKGDEVTMSYGNKSNTRMLLNYGFAKKLNLSASQESNDECRVLLYLDNSDPALKVKKNIFGHPSLLSSYDRKYLLKNIFSRERQFVRRMSVFDRITSTVIDSLPDEEIELLYNRLREFYPVITLADLKADVSDGLKAENDADSLDNEGSYQEHSEFELYIYGRGLRLGLSVDSKSTDRCLSFARFVTAKGQELLRVPFMDDEENHPSIEPDSLDWELRSLCLLKKVLIDQASRYNISEQGSALEQNLCSKYSRMVIESEYEVCIFWITLITIPLRLFGEGVDGVPKVRLLEGLSYFETIIELSSKKDVESSQQLKCHIEKLISGNTNQPLPEEVKLNENGSTETFSLYSKTAGEYYSTVILPLLKKTLEQ